VITRAVKVKTGVFLIVAALGVGYLLVTYVGLGTTLLGNQTKVYLDLPDSGGIFTTASVTYRGVEVGRVGPITLRPNGIRVQLDITSGPSIPRNLDAVVADGSAIGEQYVDLRPRSDSPPYLKSGDVITGSAASLPVNSQDVLRSVDRLMRSVPRRDLRGLVNELGTAFAGTGPDLRRLIDSTHSLLVSAQQDLPNTVGLLRHGGQVLDTQQVLSNNIVAFSQHLADFTDTLRSSDANLRQLINHGSPAATELTKTVHGVDATLPILLNNLVSVGQVAAVRIPAIRQILVIYPYVVATSYGLFPNNGSTRFGVPVPPPTQGLPCTKGYFPKAMHRLPSALKYPKLRYNAFCKEPTNSQVDPRGAREALEPDGKRLGDEPSYRDNAGLPGGAPGDSAAGSSGVTTTLAAVTPEGMSFIGPDGRQYVLGSTGGEQQVLGSASWRWLLFGPLS
jgi:phospholipid/cholesterol/gamma-HCH transport system substrate-binding protein